MTNRFANLLIVFGIAIFAAHSAYGATVKRRISQGRIVLDQGTDDEFTLGKIVCFFNQQDKKIGCGKIISAQKNRCAVKTKPQVFNKITKGFRADLRDKSGKGFFANMQGLLKNPRLWFSRRSKARPGTYFIRAGVAQHLSIAANLNEIYYKASDSETPTSNWFTEEYEKIPLSAQVEFGFPVLIKWVNLGFRYISYPTVKRKKDLEPGGGEPYALSTNQSYAFGVWVDYTFQKFPLAQNFTLSLKTGLDWDRSVVSLQLDQVTEAPQATSSALAILDSDLSVYSVRLGADFAYYMGQYGIILGVTPYFPIYTSGAEIGKAQLDDTRFSDKNAAINDFQQQLGHDKNFMGVEVHLGLEILF